LQEFEQNAVIPHGRELKFSAGDLYFSSPYLLAFTHFNAVVRGECLRLMNADLKFIGEGLQQLERQGVQFVDCSAANWSNHEPLFELKKKWATWELASGDYSTDFYTALIGFRTAVEEALTPSVEHSITAIWDEMCSIRSVLVSMQAQIHDLTRILNQRDGTKAKAAKFQPAPPIPSNGHAQQPATPDWPTVEAQPDAGHGSMWHGSSTRGPVPAAAAATPAPAVVPPVAVPTDAPGLALPPIPTPPPEEATSPASATPPPAVAAELPVVAPPANEAADPAPPEIPVEVVVEKAAPPSSEPRAQSSQPAVAPPPAVIANPAPPVTVPVVSSVAQPAMAPPAAVVNPAPSSPPLSRGNAAPEPPAGNTASPEGENGGQLAEVAAANLNDGIVKVQKILAGNGKRSAAISIAVAGTRVLLTPAEVAMFSERETACAGIVQRAVVARLYLVSALETYSKTHNKTNLAPLIALAKTEQTGLTTAVAECKAQKRTRDEEILAATGKQLAAMLERAARILR
jgi:hypothetical protein